MCPFRSAHSIEFGFIISGVKTLWNSRVRIERFHLGFPCGTVIKNLPANAGNLGSIWVGKIPRRRKWQPIPVFLPGKSHGQRSLVGYSLWVASVRHDLATKPPPPSYME